MATVVRRSNTDSIAQCGMSTATLEATGHRQSGNYVLRIAPVAARATGIQTTINKYTCKAGHFDGHGDASVRNHMHLPMEEVQSFTRSHWTLPSGKYYAQ